MLKQRNSMVYGFTLVELIVVIVILAILWTIAFISLQWFWADARDSQRLTNMKTIEKWLLFKISKWESLPMPDDSIAITASGVVISHQWYAWAWVLKSIAQAGPILDPSLNEPYTYAISSDKKKYQFLVYFQQDQSETGLVSIYNLGLSKSYAAASHTDLNPSMFWDPVWILISKVNNAPIQNQTFPWNTLDFSEISWTTYSLYLQTDMSAWLIDNPIAMMPNGSCRRILELWDSTWDGNYLINPSGSDEFEVYCDMTNDWGWWTTIKYTTDLGFLEHHSGGNAWKWLPNDFNLELSSERISAIQGISSEWKQKYIGLCNGTLHSEYWTNWSYGYAFWFKYLNGDEVPRAKNLNENLSLNVAVVQDWCKSNGWEWWTLERATIFEFSDPRVPVINVQSRDPWTGEQFWSPLIDNPAYLR